MSGFGSLYSDDFDGQDRALPSRATVFDAPLPDRDPQVGTPDEPEHPQEPVFATTDKTTLTGRTLRPRSALPSAVERIGVSYKRDSSVLSAHSIPRRIPVFKNSTPLPSSRNLIRQQISTVTKAKRDRFVHYNRALFLPLLPASNYVNRLQGRVSALVSTYQDIPQPHGINAALKPYQLTGLSFLVHMHNNGMPAILGDEMGLGKTLQTLSLFQYLKEKELRATIAVAKEARPFLVISPLTVLENWVSEARKFTPHLKVLRFHGPASERALLKDELRKKLTPSAHTRKSLKQSSMSKDTSQSHIYDLVITTYEAFETEVGWFKSVFAWRYVVLDEGHRIKNFKSNVSRSLQSLNAEYRMILTGTPLQNDLAEMWSLFHWLLPDIFAENTLPLFKNAFNLAKGVIDGAVLDHSRRLLELIMLRRMKSSPGVDLNLPPKETIRLFIPLTSLQKKWYLQMLTAQSDDMLEEIYRGAQGKEQGSMRLVSMRKDSAHDSGISAPSTPPNRAVLDNLQDSGMLDFGGSASTAAGPAKDSWKRLLNLVLQLRKICTHPYLMPGAAPRVSVIGPHVYETSGKFMALYKLIEELVLRQGKKMIIFSNFTEVLDLVYDLITYISENGTKFQCIRLDGNTLRAKRNLYVRLFQRSDSVYKIFLISTRAGGIGLTLTAATEVVFIDEDWNPQVDLQAEGRCHRIGQTKPVTIYKLCTVGTVESQMLGRIHKKLYLSAKITETMQNVHETPSKNPEGGQLTMAQSKSLFGSYTEFKSLLRRGTQTLADCGDDAEEMLKWDFNTILEKCQRKSDPATEEDDADEDKWLSTMEKVECAVFGGQRYTRERVVTTGLDVTPSSSRRDRHKGKELTIEIDGFSVSKASLECAQWEASPTFAGKDASLKDIKKTRAAINHQDVSVLNHMV
jgi:hypothetical protein